MAKDRLSKETDPFFSLCHARFSGRRYDASQDIAKEDLQLILQAGHLAPSSYNAQPWRFLICSRKDHGESYALLLSTLEESNQIWAKEAPILILVCAATLHRNKPNRWCNHDTGAAAYAMMLQATSLGMMGHQMGGFSAEKARSCFSLPEEIMPISVMALGYLLSSEKKPERIRNPISHHLFFGTWNLGQ